MNFESNSYSVLSLTVKLRKKKKRFHWTARWILAVSTGSLRPSEVTCSECKFTFADANLLAEV